MEYAIGTKDKKVFITKISKTGYSVNNIGAKTWKTYVGVKKAFFDIVKITPIGAEALKVYELVGWL